MRPQPIVRRINFGERANSADVPNLLQIQVDSYRDFLQAETAPEERKPVGLEGSFLDTFPIIDVYEKYELYYDSYVMRKPRFSEEECRTRNLTFASPLYIKLRLHVYEADADEKKLKEIKEGLVYLGDLPLMTPFGTFIINGAERVIVTQLHRSPGVFFDESIHPNGKRLFSARLIPLHGSWMELTFDVRDVIHVIISSRKKVPLSTLLRAFGYNNPAEQIAIFYDVVEMPTTGDGAKKAVGSFLARDLVDEDSGEVIFELGISLSENDIEKIAKRGFSKMHVVLNSDGKMIPVMFNTLRADKTSSKLEAVQEVYSGLRPGDVVEEGREDEIMAEYFFDVKRFDLGEVGRYKLNQRLRLNLPVTQRALIPDDFVAVAKYLILLRHNLGFIDDIDHLGVRRARAVGELLANQIRVGLARMARTVKERMRTKDVDMLSLGDLINARTVTAVINTFFGSSQLSQYMDQTNPLAELTHKRRLSALGPGGLSRERAGFEVRDVHYTHYGRMCPIETPEGQNIGLITSLATHARINEFGFIETPFNPVEKNVLKNDVLYITADEEDRHTVGPADMKISEKGKILDETIIARRREDIIELAPSEIDLADVSSAQLVSISAALIPFLEHDDASRALMGSNMQRQSVPLLFPEPPLVGTGLESVAAVDSGAVVCAKRAGTVRYVDAIHVEIIPDGESAKAELIEDIDIYDLVKYRRSNQNTTVLQRPLVQKGSHVEAGQVIADGASTCKGDLALGRNILVGFMSWHGYNYEDAIILSERLVRDDCFTSLHIENFELQVRETKLGPEELTREIPNVSEESIKDLDVRGIVRVGAHVRSGDVLAGKVTPKGETELTPELRLLKAIFGEKAGDVKDTSMRVPPGIKGVVTNTVLLSRKGTKRAGKKEKEKMKEYEAELAESLAKIKARRDKQIRELLANARANAIVSSATGQQLIAPGEKLAKQKLAKIDIDDIAKNFDWTDDPQINLKSRKLYKTAEDLFEIQKEELEIKKQKLMRGDELPPGVIHLVKVDVAMKRKVSVGDKMAGRHGNKGVISIIVPEEDMPYLEDGTPVDIILNPLGVPSRMNIGQILETHLGWALHRKGFYGTTPIFDGAPVDRIKQELADVGLPTSGKVRVFDGRTGEVFAEDVTVGMMYMMKLVHLADDKIHARSIGPYSLVTQQPLGGKAQFGGQRFGEMEVWALKAYGASYLLQEMLTVKSDDVQGRSKMYEAIVKGENPPEPGTPESFNVLVRELQSLCIDIQLLEDEE